MKELHLFSLETTLKIIQYLLKHPFGTSKEIVAVTKMTNHGYRPLSRLLKGEYILKRGKQYYLNKDKIRYDVFNVLFIEGPKFKLQMDLSV